MPQKIYVTGPVRNRTTDQLNEFAIAQERLEALGFEVTTAAEDLPYGNLSKAELNQYLKAREEKLGDADIVLALAGFEKDGYSNLDMTSAKLLEKKFDLVVDFLEKPKGKITGEEPPSLTALSPGV